MRWIIATVVSVALGIFLGFGVPGCARQSKDQDEALQDCMESWRSCADFYCTIHDGDLADDNATLLAWARTRKIYYGENPEDDEDDLYATPTPLTDPWGHEPQYRPVGGGFEIVSFGPDGEEFTDDDMIYNSRDDKIMPRRKRTRPAIVR